MSNRKLFFPFSKCKLIIILQFQMSLFFVPRHVDWMHFFLVAVRHTRKRLVSTLPTVIFGSNFWQFIATHLVSSFPCSSFFLTYVLRCTLLFWFLAWRENGWSVFFCLSTNTMGKVAEICKIVFFRKQLFFFKVALVQHINLVPLSEWKGLGYLLNRASYSNWEILKKSQFQAKNPLQKEIDKYY